MSFQHLVQFYGADRGTLIERLTRYIDEGLAAGETVVVISDAALHQRIRHRLVHICEGSEPGTEEGRLTMLDSSQTLDAFFIGGRVDEVRFDAVIGRLLREASKDSRRGVRAYGDMVNVLWHRGLRAAAVDLERRWNALADRIPFTLYCGYEIDVFGDEFEPAAMAPVLHEHSAVIPNASAELSGALNYATYESLGYTCPNLPGPEETILWLRANAPAQAFGILQRAKRYTVD